MVASCASDIMLSNMQFSVKVVDHDNIVPRFPRDAGHVAELMRAAPCEAPLVRDGASAKPAQRPRPSFSRLTGPDL